MFADLWDVKHSVPRSRDGTLLVTHYRGNFVKQARHKISERRSFHTSIRVHAAFPSTRRIMGGVVYARSIIWHPYPSQCGEKWGCDYLAVHFVWVRYTFNRRSLGEKCNGVCVPASYLFLCEYKDWSSFENHLQLHRAPSIARGHRECVRRFSS